MEFIKTVFAGIFGGLCTLMPVSYQGHAKLWGQLYSDLTGGGYDSILPLVIQFGVILALIYFLRNDLLLLIKTSGHLFKDILKREFSLDYKDRNTNYLCMVFFSSLTFLLAPVFMLIFSSMSKSLLMTGLAFLISGIMLYATDRVKEKRLSEKNETPLNAIFVGLFKLLSIMPGFSGIGGMFYSGISSGFTKEFALRFSYVLTLIAMIVSFIRNLVGLFYTNIIAGNIFGYIFAFLFSAVSAVTAIQLTIFAMRKKNFKFFGFYSVILSLFIFLVWFRG